MMGTKIFKANKKRRGRGPRYWVVSMGAMGAIVAFTVGNSRAMSVGYAEFDGKTLTLNRRSDKGADKIEFNVPAGRIEDIIAAIQKTAGVKISTPDKGILNIASPGVIGSYTIDQALSAALKGTGVSYAARDGRNFTLNLQAEAASVEIYSSTTAVIASPKYTEPLRDIPQTINIITRETIEQQGATTLRDVLNNVPGITIAAGEGGAPAGDNLTIRGFSARNDIYIDGVRDLGAQSRDSFNLEQVEVVKGPSSTFTGRGSTGGTINLISKLPNLRRSVSGTLMAGNADTKRGTLDVNVPIKDTVALRFNAMAHDANFPGRDDVQNRRWGLAPSVALGLGTATRYSFGYFYLEQDNTSDYGIPWVPAANNALAAFRDRPAPVSSSTFYGFIDRDREKLRSDLFTARFEHDFSDNLSVRSQFRYGYSKRDSIATPPRFASNNSTTINRELRSWITSDDIFDNQTDFTYRFNTGGVGHSAVFGASVSHERNHRVLRTGPGSQTTLIDPNPRDIYPGTIVINPLEGDVTGKTIAAYVFDTVRLGKGWELVGGLRWDRFDVDGVNVSTNVLVPLERVDTLLSGRAAVVFKPVETGTLYASFGTSANPSLEGLLYSPADVRTDPERTRTYELGTKWEMFGSRLLLSGALFRVQKTNARTISLIAGEPPTLDGDQRIDGIEFSATGNITRNWQLFSGYTFLSSEIIASNTTPTVVNGMSISEIGKELINTPRNSFNLWTTYRAGKFFFGGGPRFVGKRFGNNINTRFVDSYWVVDAVASYKLTRNFDVRVNLNNIGDKYYIDRIGGGHIVPGGARLVTVSTGFSF